MRPLVAITQVSLDGVLQGPGRLDEDQGGGFTRGGWAMPLVDDEVMREVLKVVSGNFDLLLGRRTYDIWNGHWPHHGDEPIGAAFNSATKHVITHRDAGLTWTTSKRIGGDVVAEVRRLKASPGPPLHLWGSGQVLQALMAADLVDEHRIWTFPVVLGQGKRLFEPGLPPRRLQLVASRSTPSGVLLATYARRPGREA